MQRIIHGDAYEKIKEIPDNSIDLIITDPPYEIVAGGGGGAFGVENRPYHVDVSKSETMNVGITNEMLKEFERVQKATNVYIFCNKNQLRQYFNFYKEKNLDLLVWKKTNPIPTLNNKYLSDLEYIFFAREKGVKLYTNADRGSKLFISQTNKQDKAKYDHPTVKPQWIIETLIANSSAKDEIVLDPFAGSGTTAAAATRLRRGFIVIELEEKHCKTIENRLKGLTKFDIEAEERGQKNIFELLDD